MFLPNTANLVSKQAYSTNQQGACHEEEEPAKSYWSLLANIQLSH